MLGGVAITASDRKTVGEEAHNVESAVVVLFVKGGLEGGGDRVAGAVAECESMPRWEFVEVGVRLPETGNEFAPDRVARPILRSFNSER